MRESAKSNEHLVQLAGTLDATSPGFASRIRDLSQRLGDTADDLERAIGATLERIVRLEGPGREMGLAVVGLSDAELRALGSAGVMAWGEAVERIAVLSLRAAQAFGVTSITAAARSNDGCRKLAAAATTVAGVTERHRSDLLLPRFAHAAGQILATRGAEVVAAWAAYFEAALVGSRPSATGVGELPLAPSLTDRELAMAIELAALVGRRDRVSAQRVFSTAPAALERVPFKSREPLVTLARMLAGDPASLLDVLEIAAPVLRRLDQHARWAVLDLAGEVARLQPSAAARFLRSVLRVGDAVGYGHDLTSFVHEGLALAERQPVAAEAFFSLETRGARAFLKRHDAAVVLEDVETTLRGYLHLIEGGRLPIAGVEASGLFPPVSSDVTTIPVSHRLQVFPIWEENFTLLKLQATLATMWRHEGTLEFQLGRWLGDDSPGGIDELFLRFAAPEAARGLFVHLEAARLQPRVKKLYPGLAADVSALRDRIFPADEVPATAGAPAAILFLALGGAPERVSWHGAWAKPLRLLAESAARGTATVYDVATCTAEHAALLQEGELVSVYGIEQFLAEDPMMSYLLELEESELPGAAPGSGDDAESPEESHRGAGHRSDEDSPAEAASRELLKAFLQQNPDFEVRRAEGPIDPMGLFVAGLLGGASAARETERRGTAPEEVFALTRVGQRARGVHLHDEWDYRIEDYRVGWCHVHELVLDGDSGEFFARTLAHHRDLLPEVRRQFQRVKPEGYRVLRGLLDGEDFDLNAVVTARADSRARRDSSPKLYTARRREERDVATLFLLDVSASTDEEIEKSEGALSKGDPTEPRARGRRIIDIQKEALVIMAQALDEIGDLYAIYGFSGHGRKRVELFSVKSFDEPLSVAVRGRIGGIEPQRSTRMGAALRQALTHFRPVAARAKHLILLSDGFPQDFDYGDDRRSNIYGLKDTAVALREVERAGVSTFCITVDRAGNDYLREMCPEERYLVIDEIDALPLELPKIYSEATRESS